MTIADLFHKLLSNSIGDSIHDLKWNYTIDQIYLLYRKCKRCEFDDYKMDAIILANSLIYTSPNKDRSGVKKAQKAWNKFLDALEWSKVTKKKKKVSEKQVISAFSKSMIPIRGDISNAK